MAGSQLLPASQRPYRRLSLVELAERVAREANRVALDEFHSHRTVFQLRGGPPMCLAEFVAALRRAPQGRRRLYHNDALLDLAYDLTIDKYVSLPDDGESCWPLKSGGADCRLYFGDFLIQVQRWQGEHACATLLEEEAAAARILQRHVAQQFRRSCREALRSSNPARTRYAWKRNGGAIYVYMPARMPGRERQRWLERNVDHPDPSRTGEGRRVQCIIDERLGVPRHVPLDETGWQPVAHDITHVEPASSIEGEISLHGLAAAVGGEKARNLDQQRPAIRALGASALRKLILRIFQDLSEGCYEEKHLAEAFGLSRATFSRFAGSRWRSGAAARPPDLWLNVAKTLANHGPLADAARAVGVWGRVEQALTELPSPEVEVPR